MASRRNRVHVLFVCAALDAGGAERHWGDLLPALRDRGFGVRLLALDGGGRALERLRSTEGIPVRELGESGVRSAVSLPAVLAEMQRGAHVVVTFGYNAHAITAVAARLAAVPHVVNWHRQEASPMALIERTAVRLAALLGAGVIAVTDAQRRDLRRLGFPDARQRVIANGTRAPTAHASRDTTRRELGLPGGGFVALMVARLRPEKRVGDFIDACAALAETMPDIQGVVVGDGPLEAELRRHATERGAPVRFAGFDRDPERWMVAADVVCLTSSHEALPMALVEALACGRPCIATAAGGVPEVVHDQANGRLVPVADVPALVEAMRALAEDPGLREAMGAHSRERWAARYSFEAMVDRYADLLAGVAGMPVRWR